MALLSATALLAVFAVLRRVTRSSLLGLALFAPFLATGLFMKEGARVAGAAACGLLVEFARLYGSGGHMMLPMPVLGWHVVVFLTAVACVVVAAVRLAGREEDRLLTGSTRCATPAAGASSSG